LQLFFAVLFCGCEKGLVNVYDIAVVGGGIVGLATVRALKRHFPDWKIIVLEKEAVWGYHQTGHNSGVIHSGIYYKPGSLKAKLTRAGNQEMVAFCEDHDIPFEICGKLIVATEPEELPLMENLLERGQANGLTLKKVSRDEIREIEPHVRGLAGIHVPATGIVDYKAVCSSLAEDAKNQGTEMRLSTEVLAIQETESAVVLETRHESISAKYMINCGGLHSDRIAQMTIQNSNLRIVPFRGEYYEIKRDRRHLVKNLIYPVPNPLFPFLGVHFTRMVNGSVEAGPNAVLSLKREGYHKTDISLRDFTDVIGYKGFWRLASKYWRYGSKEMIRSFIKVSFVRSLQRLIPEIESKDLVPAPAGVRAQALRPDGSLVDDFYFLTGKRALHVCNAPSPAATASLQIGQLVVEKLVEQFHLTPLELQTY
jgi:(S)-2-hydroxyglutarate dehydrogenase